MDASPRIVESQSVAQTEAAAGEVAKLLEKGGIVTLEGGLGAGKTQFVRGLVSALGGDGRQVHSPTFVLLHAYDLPAGRHLYHLDAYRVSGEEDLEAIGFDELLAATREGDIIALEWPTRVAGLIPSDALAVRLDPLGEHTRRITWTPTSHSHGSGSLAAGLKVSRTKMS